MKVIEALNKHQVRYVIVGGFAAVMHGSDRATRDLDIIVDLEPNEARKAIDAMVSIGFQNRVPVDPYLFTDAEERKRWKREKNAVVFTMLDPDFPVFVVDFFIENPIEFQALFDRALTAEFKGLSCRVCSIDDLIDLKKQAGRPKDLVDIDMLQRLKSNPPNQS